MNWKEGLERCTKFLNRHQVHLADKKLLLAVSGGIDSMFMLAIVAEMQAKISVAHVNYGLRGSESDADAMLVSKTCEAMGLPLHEKHIDLKKISQESKESLQQLGRHTRYEWFDMLYQSGDFDYVCTAHQQDDSAESFFINLIRGTGMKGLTGIPVLRDNILRPLLCFTREEIEDLVRQRKIQYRDDVSNIGRSYLRNRIRHDIIPVFQAERPGFITRMHATQQRLSEEFALMDEYLAQMKDILCSTEPDGMKVIDRTGIMKTKSPAIVLLYLLQEYGFSFHQCNRMILSSKDSGQKFLSLSHQVIIDRARICIVPLGLISGEESILLNEKGDYILSTGEFSVSLVDCPTDFSSDSNIELVDVSKITGVLQLRHWQPGDFFYPIGGPGKQKLQDYFTNEKVSVLDKKRVWVVTMNDDIVWVVGMRLDERYKITQDTKVAMRFEWRQNFD